MVINILLEFINAILNKNQGNMKRRQKQKKQKSQQNSLSKISIHYYEEPSELRNNLSLCKISQFVVLIGLGLMMLMFMMQFKKGLPERTPKIQSLLTKYSEEITFLQQKLFCQDIKFVTTEESPKEQQQISMNDIEAWIEEPHTYQQSLSEQQNSIHKCAIIESSDMKANLVHYKGFQFIIFEESQQSQLIKEINTEIANKKLGNIVKLSWEKTKQKQYAVLQFFHPLVQNKKGFFMGNEKTGIQKQHVYVQTLNNKLIEFYKREHVKTIVDFGCGLCNYAINLRDYGFQVTGFDGNPYTPQLTNGFASTLDLTEPQDLQTKFEWAQSFEVGQHIPPQKTTVFIENIVKHASKGILISWAVVGQVGFHHINNKGNKEVISLLKPYGFQYDEAISDEFQSQPNMRWFANSFMAFRKINKESNKNKQNLQQNKYKQPSPYQPAVPSENKKIEQPQKKYPQVEKPRVPVENPAKQPTTLPKQQASHALDSRQIEELTFLKQELMCNEIVVVKNSDKINNNNEMSVSSISNWISEPRYGQQILEEQQKAIHKCAIIELNDMKPEFINYKGFEYIIIQASRDSFIIDTVQREIIASRQSQLIKISWKEQNSKSFAVIQFFHPLGKSVNGYYMGNEERKINKEHGYFIIELNNKLIEFYRRQNIKTIVDFGCGLCNYAINIKNAGFEVDGYDGNPYTPQLTKGFAKTIDLTQIQNLEKKYDWVQSFEVGEHIPPTKTTVFIENLLKHAKKGIFLSWAVIGQGGYYHINNKSNKQIIQILKGYGFQHDEALSNQFRTLPNMLWFANSLMAFRKVDAQKIINWQQTSKPEKGQSIPQKDPSLEKAQPVVKPVTSQNRNKQVDLSHRYSADEVEKMKFLKEKLLCKQVYIVRNTQQVDEKTEYPLVNIKSWVQEQHTQQQKTSQLQKSIFKCAVIESRDIKPEYIKFQGFEYMVYDGGRNSLITNLIQSEITANRLWEKIKISEEQFETKKYTVLQFFHPLGANTKGYFQGNQESDIKREHVYLQQLNDKLIEFYRREKVQSIIDFGCGLCNYAINLKTAGFNVTGYDGNPYTPELTNGFAAALDLTEPQDLKITYEWAQSFEVGEHIPPQKTKIFVENIVKHASKGVILSWAVIGQTGFHHINNKANEEVISIMNNLGFQHDPLVSNEFRTIPDMRWFANSLMVFRKKV